MNRRKFKILKVKMKEFESQKKNLHSIFGCMQIKEVLKGERKKGEKIV